MGAFELNNIELKIDSPLRSYLRAITELAPAPRAEALAALSPVLRQAVAARAARRDLAQRVCELLGEEDEEEDEDDEDEDEDEVEGEEGAAGRSGGGSSDSNCVWLPADALGPALRVPLSTFPACDGTALMSLTCCANHSCAPNVQLTYGEDHTGALLALRDLVPGEELCINYVGIEQPRALRNADLMHYGFTCTCERCEEEGAAEAAAAAAR